LCDEDGSNLSGGEKQRISIARALLRRTPVLIIDEGTSALDTQTSYEIENMILKLDNVTRIVITHKFNPGILKGYDQIIVMNNGVIAESVNYDELIARGELFYSMVKIFNEAV
jgi:ATP-binding cassette subfamily C protein